MFLGSDRCWSALQKRKQSASKTTTQEAWACIPWMHIWIWNTIRSFSARSINYAHAFMHSRLQWALSLTYHWSMNSEHWTIRCYNGIPFSNLCLHKKYLHNVIVSLTPLYIYTWHWWTFVELQQPELVEWGLELVRGGLEGSLFTVITLASYKPQHHYRYEQCTVLARHSSNFVVYTFAFSSFSPISVAPFSPHLTFILCHGDIIVIRWCNYACFNSQSLV